MIDPQEPIGSGFGAESTTTEILSGIDLAGKRAIVTGGHSGLGLETVKALVAAGANVTIASRDVESAKAATYRLPYATVSQLDLADLQNIRAFCERELGNSQPIDLLINNAGVMACAETRVGQDWEAQFAINHLGHFALTNSLLPLLRRGGRVITVSSAGHHNSPMRWSDINFATGYDKWLAYGQSKTANVLFSVELDRRARGQGVRAFAVHPGKILTPLQRHLSLLEMVEQGWVDQNGAPADPTFKSLKQGAATQLWAAVSPDLEGRGGLYCEDCDVAHRAEHSAQPFSGVTRYATDPVEAERLWALSVDLTGVSGPEP